MSNNVAGVPGKDASLPDVSIILGGVERHLCFDYNAIVLAEQETGVNLLQAFFRAPTAAGVRGLLWAALLREKSGLTLEKVGSYITMRNVLPIWESIQKAWYASTSGDEEEEQADAAGEEQAQAAS